MLRFKDNFKYNEPFASSSIHYNNSLITEVQKENEA